MLVPLEFDSGSLSIGCPRVAQKVINAGYVWLLVGKIGVSFGETADLENFARRFQIPYIDIGMEVFDDDTHYSIVGQAARSIPGEPCLWCMRILTQESLAEEAQKYGAAGGQPQVVWPNGVLASTAVGLFIEMVTPWHQGGRPAACQEYDGNRHSLESSNILNHLVDGECPHFNLKDAGDFFFKFPHTKK